MWTNGKIYQNSTEFSMLFTHGLKRIKNYVWYKQRKMRFLSHMKFERNELGVNDIWRILSVCCRRFFASYAANRLTPSAEGWRTGARWPAGVRQLISERAWHGQPPALPSRAPGILRVMWRLLDLQVTCTLLAPGFASHMHIAGRWIENLCATHDRFLVYNLPPANTSWFTIYPPANKLTT